MVMIFSLLIGLDKISVSLLLCHIQRVFNSETMKNHHIRNQKMETTTYVITSSCNHTFCKHLLKLKEKKNAEAEERIQQQRKDQLEEKMRMRVESLKNSHFLAGTENDPYYTCKFCNCQLKNTYPNYIKHNAVCLKKKKRKR